MNFRWFRMERGPSSEEAEGAKRRDRERWPDQGGHERNVEMDIA
jgi:hypothetical protein